MSPSISPWLSRWVLRLLLPWLPILICLASFPASAELLEGFPSRAAMPVVKISGNERTRREIILAAAAIGPSRLDGETLAQIRQRLLNLRLFETVEVTGEGLETAAPTIVVRVKERWTLFPIPFFSSSSRGIQGGVFLLESNLFGRNKMIVAGGSYASWGGALFSLYQDPSLLGTRATLRASMSYSENERERRIDDEVVYAYEDQRFELMVLPGVQLSERVNLSAGWYVMHSEGTTAGWAASLDYRGADFVSYYDEGLSAGVLYKQARESLGSARDVLDVNARISYTRAWLPNQATTLSAQLDLISGDLVDVRLLGGRPGSRGFAPQSLWADRAATLTLQHQVPFWIRGWGIWTAAAFVDLGYASLDGHREAFITPGAGLRLNLPRTSFPAVGLDASYSLESDELYTTVSVGISM